MRLSKVGEARWDLVRGWSKRREGLSNKGGWREWGSVRRGKIQREGYLWLGEWVGFGEEDGDVVELGMKRVDLGEEGTELKKKGEGTQRRVGALRVPVYLPPTDIQEVAKLNRDRLLSTLWASWGCVLPTLSILTLRDLCGLVRPIHALPVIPEDFLFLLMLKQRGLAHCILPGKAQESLPARIPVSPFPDAAPCPRTASPLVHL